MIKKVTGALLIAIPLAGCATYQDHKGRLARCDRVCHIKVEMKGCTYNVTGGDVYVSRALGPDVRLVWTLTNSPGYKFAANGVFFKDDGSQFHSPGNSGAVFMWTDRNTADGKFRYGIRVNDGTRDCPDLDPMIVNGP